MSFRMQIDPRAQAAAEFIGGVRDELLRALLAVKERTGITQSDIAKRLGVHRSVVNRELSGHANLTLRRVAELAWALEQKVVFRLEPEDGTPFGCNTIVHTSSSPQRTTISSAAPPSASEGVIFRAQMPSAAASHGDRR